MSQLQNPPPSGTAQCEITGKWVPEDEIVEIQGKRVCAEGKQILLDRLKAGEALPGELEPPGLLRRLGCAILDGILMGVAGALIGAVVGFTLATGTNTSEALIPGVSGILGGLVSVAYFTLMHAGRGQTAGKMAGRIKVVSQDGSPITTRQAFWRAMLFSGVNLIPAILLLFVIVVDSDVILGVVMIANFAVGLYALANAVTLLLDRKQQRSLHDRIAGTRVIQVG